MHEQQNRNQQEAPHHKQKRDALEPAEAAGARRDHDQQGGGSDAPTPGHAKIIESEADADELGDDGQGVQQEKIDDAERAQFAEAFQNEPRMPNAGNGAQAEYHLLVDMSPGIKISKFQSSVVP